ncbi:hypothetical protein [Streptomyces ureilyticus]|uniref:Uncharacterized protein n=1 Tax=Streptomyces ureilyticus TaxID=1775131 RepID=A0ABX0DZF9_9ACTN|nr:hypothetical protein [Streptomyces ureilyticus]NGO46304.1 hypothetical protein [Streptomyces ureilyticus]
MRSYRVLLDTLGLVDQVRAERTGLVGFRRGGEQQLLEAGAGRGGHRFPQGAVRL